MTTSTDERDDLIRLGVKPSLRTYLREVWAKRDFTTTGSMGDLRAQNMNTLLGGVWHLFNPLLLAAVYYLVFGIIFDAADIEGTSYAAFLVIGIFVFTFTQKSMAAGSRTVIANLPLIQSLQFPRAVLPIGAVMTEAMAQVPAIGMMLLLVLLTGEPITFLWPLLLGAVALQAAFNLGLALATARMTFHFRDTQQLLPYFTRLWLYLSGVFYTAERIPAGWPRTLFELNPVHAYIQLSREILLFQAVEGRTWAIASAWSVGMLVGGFFFFRAKEVDYGRGY
jgi:teichoic acid transport system permease protein